MTQKYELITELYERTIHTISSNPNEWKKFLCSACRNYKLPFDELVLIYAQRPDATAVLEIRGKKGWNMRFGRWVNQGAAGIAVFDPDHEGGSRLKHYFDISDTHESSFARPVPIWDVHPEYESELIETLENSYGQLENKADFASALISAAQNAVEDNMTDYLTELHFYKENSFLEELDDLNIEVLYRTTLYKNVGYMLLARCGIETQEYFADDDFRGVLSFNTPETLNALGTATGDIAQMCLLEISRTVLNLQRHAEKQNHTFAEVQQNDYSINRSKNNNSERSYKDERDHIHQTGRLQSAEFIAATGVGSASWEVRNDATEVPETEPARDLHKSVDIGQTERSPDGNRADSHREDGTSDRTDEAITGRDGGTESQRPDEMGWADEQHPPFSGGNNSERTNLQLEFHDRATEDKSLPFFHV